MLALALAPFAFHAAPSPDHLRSRSTAIAMNAPRPSVHMNPSWDFRHGVGGSALATEKAIDGTVAMRSSSAARAPSAASAPQGTHVTDESRRRAPGPVNEWDFRHGVGSSALAGKPAIDGSVAMRSSVASAPSANEKSWPGASDSPADEYEFRHGTGGPGGAEAHYMPRCL